MWSKVCSTTCSFMEESWFYFYKTQPNLKYHSQTDKRCVQRYPCWASIMTTDWWNSSIINSTENEVRLDICARVFWQTGQVAFFDIRAFNTNAKRYFNQDIQKRMNLMSRKKRSYRNWAWKFYSTGDVSHR